MRSLSSLVISLVLILTLAACGGAATEAVDAPAVADVGGQGPATAAQSDPPAVADADPDADPALPTGERLRLRVVGERPHDATAFTQGLEFDDGRLFESRGLFAGREDVILTEIDPADGSTIRSLTRPDQPDFFAEGLTVVDDRIVQITWMEQTAFVYDRETFALTETYSYDGQGWGICDTADALYMSNGSATLTRRDLATFETTAEVEVTLDGLPVERLNELECVGDQVLANVWQTNTIVVIDPTTGEVTSTIDASPIAQASGRWAEDPAAADVLNGIAYDPAQDLWLVTGKLWPVMYEVEFDCVSGCGLEPLTYYIRPGN